MAPFSTTSRRSPMTSADDFAAAQIEHRDTQPMTSRCLWCRDFVAIGPAAHVRESFAIHLALAHPAVKVPKRRRSRSGFAQFHERRREQAA